MWGLGKPGFHLPDAATCCKACQAHNAVCGQPNARGKSWWPSRPEMHCGSDVSVACTIWTWCPEERCFAFDIHKHEFGECWLKFQKVGRRDHPVARSTKQGIACAEQRPFGPLAERPPSPLAAP